MLLNLETRFKEYSRIKGQHPEEQKKGTLFGY